MIYTIIKILITSGLVVAVSEIAKRSSMMAGILASIPLISVLGFVWLYIDTKDVEKISSLSTSIFWLVIPSLALFVTLPILLKKGFGFYPSLGVATSITVVCYYLMILILGKFGIKL
ncbi:MAG TPA: DUF3147 family protein [Candidatus Marinimicrobia bacterium]|jgi:hypothetical protein|nr:DUF3147 family protein [Candidatus Neomarinimicrobiota bacterium]